MPNPGHDNQDQIQRENCGMEDSDAKTVEFLRARLLSERSVSRSARQRADELAKRVAELEEQLKVESLQRKRAEKATADIVAILENQGISDVSEEFDLSSDQDSESKVGCKPTKGEGSSVNSNLSRNKLEELSGSDLDASPVRGRSLSWKGRSDSVRSLQKYKDSSLRRKSSFASSGSSSPKQCAGKSCRQIRCREAGYIVEEFKTNPVELGSAENGVANSSKGFPICSGNGLKEGSEIQEKVLVDGPHPGCFEKHVKVGDDLDRNEYGKGKDMEKALEDQAQLIGQYEAMEKAQREWEEKFRENNTGTPDSCDPGNDSDITDKRDEVKPQASYPPETVAFHAQDAKSEVTDVFFSKEQPKTPPHAVLPPSHVGMGDTQNLANSNNVASESVAHEFSFCTQGKQNEGRLATNRHQPSHGSPHEPRSNGSPGNHSAHLSSSNADSSYSKRDSSVSQNDVYALVPHEPSGGLSSVLEALKKARVSLEQKITQAPSIESASVSQAAKPLVPALNTGDLMEIPIGCAGLFRLPTDFSVAAGKQGNFLGSGSSNANYFSNKGVALTAGDQMVTSPYLETRSGFSTSDRYLAGRYAETLSRVSTEKPQFGSHLDNTPSSSGRYPNPAYPRHPSYPSYRSYTSYPELLPWMHSDEGFSRTSPSRGGGVPPAEKLFYDDRMRPNMYR